MMSPDELRAQVEAKVAQAKAAAYALLEQHEPDAVRRAEIWAALLEDEVRATRSER